MSIAPETSTVKNSLSAHAAIGLIAGALLYIVSLSGTVLVFYDELQQVEHPGIAMTSVEPEAVERAGAAIMARETGNPPTAHLYFHLPSPAYPRFVGYTDTQEVLLDRNGGIVDDHKIGWSKFLYSLHYELTVPGAIGLTIVGILGVMMLSLSISGVIAHPRIFRDAFRLRARDGGGVALADWHNRLSVWTLPFIVMIALTGATIGLGLLTVQSVALRYFGGDTEAAYAPVFGGEHPVDLAPAALPAIVKPLQYMQANYPGVEVTFVTVHDPMTRGQSIQVMGEHPRRMIFGEYYNFDAAGNFEHTTGLADGELGQQAAASNYRLHFGDYGGLPVKIAYFLFGAALTAVCATGTFIWLGKRRRRGIVEPRLRAAWHGIVWGTPIALGVTALARLAIGNAAPFVAIFWVALAAAVAVAVWRANRDATAAGLRPLPAE